MIMIAACAVDDVSSEFLMEMRRDASFEASGFAVVISFQHLGHGMEASHGGRIMVRHAQFDKFARGPKHGSQLRQQLRYSFPGFSGDSDSMGERVKVVAPESIGTQ